MLHKLTKTHANENNNSLAIRRTCTSQAINSLTLGSLKVQFQ